MSAHIFSGKEISPPIDIFLRQAEAYIQSDNWEKAIASCKRVLKLNQNVAEAYKLMGDAFHGMRQIAEALGCYGEALLIQPEYPDVYVHLGALYGSLNNWEQAAIYYQTATELEPGCVEAHRQLAKVWEKLDKPQDYVDTIYQSLSLSPETFTADEHSEMGQLLLIQEQEYEAMACFERAIELEPDHPEARKHLDELLEKKKNGTLIAPSGERTAPPLGPDSADPEVLEKERVESIEALVILARSYIQNGDVDKAIPYYEKAFSLDCQNVRLYQEIIEILGQAGQDEKIVDIQYQALISNLEGVPAETYIQLGDRFLQKEQLVKAVECYRCGVRAHPDSIELAQKLIYGLKAIGQLQEAAQEYFSLAQVLQQQQRTREAIELLQNALMWLNLEINQ